MERDQWITAQIGAREHYAVPRSLHRRGLLTQLYTDAWCAQGRFLLRQLPNPARSLASRYHPDLGRERVTHYLGISLLNKIIHRLWGGYKDRDRYQRYVDEGKAFAHRVYTSIRSLNLEESRAVFFGYDTGSYEVLEGLEDTDWFTIVDQIDPGPVEKKIVLQEMDQWPGWVSEVPVIYKPYVERRRKEWDRASAVIVNSAWSKQALVEQGVSANKIHIVPLAYEATGGATRRRGVDKGTVKKKNLRVLWLGQVSLRKGIQYLMEAAHELLEASIEFSVVGPLRITDKAASSAPPNMTFHGRVPRDEVSYYYRNADVFVLPTLSDGFAITQLEAMAHGLPVVTTPNCGRVVRDGKEGFVVPPRDPEALVDAFLRLTDHRALVHHMSENALSAVQRYTLDRVADELTAIVNTEADSRNST